MEVQSINLLNAELNPICLFQALLGAHHILHISRIRVKSLSRHSNALVQCSCQCSYRMDISMIISEVRNVPFITSLITRAVMEFSGR